MSDKNEVLRNALATLKVLTSGLPAESRREAEASLNTIDRFSGELRRKLAMLEKDAETSANDVNSFRSTNANLASEIAKLDAKVVQVRQENARKLAEAQEEHERRLTEARRPGINLPSAKDTDAAFVVVKAKCLACSLHFLVASWEPDKHDGSTLHCPECGQNGGAFLVWKDTVRGFIFELIGGSSPLAM
jgi:predicted nuclease with TOPRIM domain